MSGRDSPPDQPSLLLTLVLGAASTFAAVAIEMYLPALPRIAADLRSPPGGVEQTISVFLAALAGGQLVYGPASDRFGRRAPLLFGMGLYAAASIACSLATSIGQLVAFRFLQGLGGCAGPVIVRAIVRDRYPPDRVVHILSTLALVSGCAPLLAPIAGGAILSLGSWRLILWAQAVFGALVTLAVAAVVRDEPRDAPVPEGAGVAAAYRAVLSNRRVVAYVLTAGFGGSVLFVYGALMPAFASARYGLGPHQIAWTLAGGAAVMMVFSQLNRPLLRRYSSDQILRAANLAAIAIALVLCAAAWTGAGGLWGVVAPVYGVLALRGLSMPNASASALLSERTHIGVASALFGAGLFAGGALMAAIAAHFADGTARPMAAGVLAALLLAAGAVWRTPAEGAGRHGQAE